MPNLFYIGLSLMSSLCAQTAAERRERHSAEGRRIVSLLDAEAIPLARPDETKFIEYEPGGRPYFSDYHADFNISHSRNMVAAAFLSSPEGRTGCDIQHLAPGKSFVEISRRFFHAGEQAYIEEAGTAQMRNFYRIWVLKEAWLKLHGLSVFDMAKAPVFSIGGTPQTGTDKSGLVFFLYELSPPASSGDESYMLAAAFQRVSSSGGDEEAEPEIRWFSDAALTLNRVENIYAAQSPEKTVMPKI
jgi:phosphopantetheinyl transferase